MAENKTKPSSLNVESFLAAIKDEKKRVDCEKLADIFRQVTDFVPVMWGPDIVGFGSYHYKYPSGREGDAPLTGFSPRKEAISIYLTAGFIHLSPLMEKLGKYKTGKGCLYVKKIEDIDLKVLEQLIRASIEYLKKLYPVSSTLSR